MRAAAPILLSFALRSALLSSLAWGCAGVPKPVPLSAPTVSVQLDHYQGTPLSGPRLGLFEPYPIEPSGAPPEQALGVSVRVLAAAGMPDGGLIPLTSVTRLAAMPLSDEPLRATLPLIDGARVGRESGRMSQAREQVYLDGTRGALDLGMTCVASITAEHAPEVVIKVLLHRPPDDHGLALHLALVAQGTSGELVRWEQALVEAAPTPGGEPVLVALPLDNGSGDLVLELLVLPARPGDLAHRVQVERARRDAAAHLADMRDLMARIRAGVPDRTGVLAALVGLESDEARRAALLHVASITGADATRDVALTGREDLLAAVVAALDARIPDGYMPTLEELAWICEQVSLEHAASRVEDETDEPAMEALLLRHTGEAGRNLPLVLGLLDDAVSLADLRARLSAENLLFLDDSSPASRVRAYDWLLLRNLAPEGYDPLGPRSERRAALARLQQPAVPSAAPDPGLAPKPEGDA